MFARAWYNEYISKIVYCTRVHTHIVMIRREFPHPHELNKHSISKVKGLTNVYFAYFVRFGIYQTESFCCHFLHAFDHIAFHIFESKYKHRRSWKYILMCIYAICFYWNNPCLQLFRNSWLHFCYDVKHSIYLDLNSGTKWQFLFVISSSQKPRRKVLWTLVFIDQTMIRFTLSGSLSRQKAECWVCKYRFACGVVRRYINKTGNCVAVLYQRKKPYPKADILCIKSHLHVIRSKQSMHI